ncbi:MAG: cellulase family glycosylhydrolase [Clostridia bacterium]|nr:cellulase family glycosylhydrolase [Clostridia bacterium]
MNTTFSEFFYFDPALPSGHNDFTDDRVIGKEKRLEFLRQYANHLKQNYSLPDMPEKVVDPAAARALLETFDREALPQVTKRLVFDTMTASLEAAPQAYSGWSLYTPYAAVELGALRFRERGTAPPPAAAYALDSADPIKSFTFSFMMDSAYSAPIPGGILDTTTGRTVELRSGIHDLVKLHFYANGMCYVRLGNECPYHLKNVPVGPYAFDTEQTVRIDVTDKTFSVTLNGVRSEEFPLSYEAVPDMLFIGCGMFHVGEWIVRPLALETESGTYTEFFRPAAKATAARQLVGEVSLPYCVGGYENRDKRLVLEKEFEVTPHQKAILTVESLDPHGRVVLNGTTVLETDGFEKHEIDVSSFVNIGQNRLEITVEPRAPETLFNWHRQTDAYNGWFCNQVSLTLVNALEVKDVEVLTTDVSGDTVTCSVSATFDRLTAANVYIRKIFPVEEQTETRILQVPVCDRLAETISFKADVWSPETPVLYAVRVEACDETGTPIDDAVVETGFRTISQVDGRLTLNGKPFVMTGALLMQFLPPYSETSRRHISPTSELVLWQEMMGKELGSNTLRLHVLGYGTNDARYARYADRLGLMLIWITRYIDSVEQLMFEEEWRAKEGYIAQLRARINHPSIVMWEGTNEYHPSLRDIDRIYKNFVPAVKAVDPTRLICPVSHLYYAGDMIPKEGCAFYNDAGTADHAGNPVTAPAEWSDPQVVRSAHTYEVLLGYGTGWDKMRKQSWSMQPELYASKQHAYLVTEFAVIGRQDPRVPEAQTYFNHYSYEFPNDDVLGFRFSEDQWEESQAYQALAAKVDTQIMRLNDVDGMLWCCLMGGANDGGYLKPPIDNYGYPKLAFYTLRDSFAPVQVLSDDVDVIKAPGFSLSPVVVGTEAGAAYTVTATIYDAENRAVAQTEYAFIGKEHRSVLPAWTPELSEQGYYHIGYSLHKEEK